MRHVPLRDIIPGDIFMFLYIFSGIFMLLSLFALFVFIRTIAALCIMSYEKRKAAKEETEKLKKEIMILKNGKE